MDFTGVKAITIPEGNVARILDSAGNVLWAQGMDKYTKVLMHFDESVIKDECGNTWGAGLYVGLPSLSTHAKFGKAMYTFNSSFIQTNDIRFGFTEDFTIEAWIYPNLMSTDVNSGFFIGEGDNSNDYDWYLGYYRDGFSVRFKFDGGTSGYIVPIDKSKTYSQWQHVALVRHGTFFKFFWNGVLYHNLGLNVIKPIRSNYSLKIGNVFGGFEGYIDEVRISDGIARWTKDFTPPDNHY